VHRQCNVTSLIIPSSAPETKNSVLNVAASASIACHVDVRRLSRSCGIVHLSGWIRKIFGLESLHSLPRHSDFKGVMSMLTAEQVLVHLKPIGRLIFAESRWSHNSCACRLPLHERRPRVRHRLDSSSRLFDQLRPLQRLAGSDRFGLAEQEIESLYVP
jgi:hypothetical protein